MIKKEDIKRAIRTFKEWDNKKLWKIPTEIFKFHTLEKSGNALKTAGYVLKIMEDPKARDFFDAEDGLTGIFNLHNLGCQCAYDRRIKGFRQANTH